MLGDFGHGDIVDWWILRTKSRDFGCLEISNLDICLGTHDFQAKTGND